MKIVNSTSPSDPYPNVREQRIKLFSRFRDDPRLWIERCLKIVNKSGKEVPFKLNQIQSIYYEELKRKYWKPYILSTGKTTHRFQGIREVNLKARQFGLSSLICAILLHDTLFFPSTRTWLFCQDDDASKTMLDERIKYYFNSINRQDPLIVLPVPDKDNTKELSFSVTSSKISARTPGQSQAVSRKKGRSITLRNALLSELEEWPYAEELIQGIDPALNDPSTNIFIESSPRIKGGYFHRFYKLGKDPESGWTSRFWPWFLHDEYQVALDSESQRTKIEKSLTAEELKLIEQVRKEWSLELSMEQIRWRRRTKASPTLATKGPQAFRQEYPENDEDCFESAGSAIFVDPDHDLKVLTCQEREAIPGHIHSIGVDVADGAGGDYSVITVIDAETREQIYQWRSNYVSSTDLHLHAYDVWKRYPGAVFIETNGIGRATIAKARSDMTLVTNPEGETVPLCVDWDDFVHAGHNTYDGMPTLSEKSTTIYLMRGAIVEAVEFYTDPLNKQDSVVGLRIGSQTIIDEFDEFQNLGGNKMGAPKGAHDDCIMSLSVAFKGLSEVFDYKKAFNNRFVNND